MTPNQFAAWRARYFKSPHACAVAFGIDPRAVQALEDGVTRNGTPCPVPAHMELACAAWTMGVREYDGGPGWLLAYSGTMPTG